MDRLNGLTPVLAKKKSVRNGGGKCDLLFGLKQDSTSQDAGLQAVKSVEQTRTRQIGSLLKCSSSGDSK